MTAEVIVADFETTLDLPPDRILEGAKGKLEAVILIGRTPEGGSYFGSSTADKAQIVFMLESMKHDILAGEFG